MKSPPRVGLADHGAPSHKRPYLRRYVPAPAN
jgi:hypothetical protein